jgi:hypothetical protein
MNRLAVSGLVVVGVCVGIFADVALGMAIDVTALATFRLRSYSITSLPPPMQQPRLGPELEANSVAAIG